MAFVLCFSIRVLVVRVFFEFFCFYFWRVVKSLVFKFRGFLIYCEFICLRSFFVRRSFVGYFNFGVVLIGEIFLGYVRIWVE